jgi:hypothetical protein
MKESTEYQKFFRKAMKKFGIKSPSELDGEKEKEFYDYVDKNWESDDEKSGLDEVSSDCKKSIKENVDDILLNISRML